ncbi:Hypothetical protein SMAX5B_001849 [Scophthalmus maximus]|uniref:Uncharacterized protein n=1 Tax=Scophthalmus maximus TaxID=52904 RepID=A0A2U9BS69_SCOMX|nr:Hypothetical protein SMAX5B_001849 [Scophthalmus maximus]
MQKPRRGCSTSGKSRGGPLSASRVNQVFSCILRLAPPPRSALSCQTTGVLEGPHRSSPSACISTGSFQPPAVYTGELICIDYLYRQTGQALQDVHPDSEETEQMLEDVGTEELDVESIEDAVDEDGRVRVGEGLEAASVDEDGRVRVDESLAAASVDKDGWVRVDESLAAASVDKDEWVRVDESLAAASVDEDGRVRMGGGATIHEFARKNRLWN